LVAGDHIGAVGAAVADPVDIRAQAAAPGNYFVLKTRAVSLDRCLSCGTMASTACAGRDQGIMFRTIGDLPSLWECLLPPEVLRLPGDLAAGGCVTG
jgi:hypothetical protein